MEEIKKIDVISQAHRAAVEEAERQLADLATVETSRMAALRSSILHGSLRSTSGAAHKNLVNAAIEKA